MFAIAFDMVVAEIRQHYPKGISSAYTEIGRTLPFADHCAAVTLG